MKVCLLNDSFPPIIDGVANTVANYASILTADNLAEVEVGTPRYPEAQYDIYPYKVVPYSSIDAKKLIEGYRVGNPMAVKAMTDLTEFCPDIIHVHCPAASAVMARMMRHELQVPIVFTYHTKFDVDIAKAVKSKVIQKETLNAIVNNISACDEVWVVSRGAGENLRSLGYEGEYRIMNNGVDFPKGRATEEAVKDATKNYDLPTDVPVFLFVGRIMKYKGLPIIVDALNILNKKGMDFRMVFVGNGADMEEIKKSVEDYGLSGKVFFTGSISDREVLRAWNTRADLFLFPSTYDTNGIVVREAAACGLASVLIKDSCASEGITHGRNGYLIEETPESMSDLLLGFKGKTDALADAGTHAMDEIYISWEDSVKIAHQRYGEIIEAKKSGALSGRKRQFSDFFMAAGSNALDGAQLGAKVMHELHEGMLENIDEVRENLSGLRNDIRYEMSEFHSDVRRDISNIESDVRNIEGGMKRGMQEIKGEFQEFREDVQEIREDIQARRNKD